MNVEHLIRFLRFGKSEFASSVRRYHEHRLEALTFPTRLLLVSQSRIGKEKGWAEGWQPDVLKLPFSWKQEQSLGNGRIHKRNDKGKSQRNMNFDKWNVLGWYREAVATQLVQELEGPRMDITAIQKIRWPDSGSMTISKSHLFYSTN